MRGPKRDFGRISSVFAPNFFPGGPFRASRPTTSVAAQGSRDARATSPYPSDQAPQPPFLAEFGPDGASPSPHPSRFRPRSTGFCRFRPRRTGGRRATGRRPVGPGRSAADAASPLRNDFATPAGLGAGAPQRSFARRRPFRRCVGRLRGAVAPGPVRRALAVGSAHASACDGGLVPERRAVPSAAAMPAIAGGCAASLRFGGVRVALAFGRQAHRLTFTHRSQETR